ncbi:MAG: hypothetical protein ABWK01_05175 [Infirmifilum sp.]
MNGISGCIINLLSSEHPHFRSFLLEGLWGFTDIKVNRKRWSALKPGMRALLYFNHHEEKGVWGIGEVVEVFESKEPVSYWIQNPRGFPLQVRLSLVHPVRHKFRPEAPLEAKVFDRVVPVRKGELAALGVKQLKPQADQWSLILFGEGDAATYPGTVFEKVLEEFSLRNSKSEIPDRLSHDEAVELIAEIGKLQGRFVEREVELEGKRVDVVWKVLERSAPRIAFEVSIGGDLYADLVKLKHAVDMWNSIAVLVTTREKKEEALKWLGGAFHEVRDYFRVLTVEELLELYKRKLSYKELESRLGLV